jgi:FkbM family methyltransferase
MTLRKSILFYLIKVHRYVLRRKFIAIFDGPLKGYLWSTAFNYDYLTGDYVEPMALELLSSKLKPDSVFYDLGANIGYYSFIANKIIRSGRIYSFEPIPLNLAIFRQHILLNQRRLESDNIELMGYGISDAEKEIFFSANEYSEGNTYVDSEMQGLAEKKLRVKCHSMDDLVEQGFRAPNMIKIDVEGAEFDVLRGARKVIHQHKPIILLATHDCHVPGIQKSCVDLLSRLGYELTKLPGHNKTMIGLVDYIAIHKDRVSG